MMMMLTVSPRHTSLLDWFSALFEPKWLPIGEKMRLVTDLCKNLITRVPLTVPMYNSELN